MNQETTHLIKTMAKAVESVGEHADSVLILVSTNDPNGGYAFAEMGVGNPFTHEGLVREWLRRKEDEIFWEQEPPTNNQK